MRRGQGVRAPSPTTQEFTKDTGKDVTLPHLQDNVRKTSAYLLSQCSKWTLQPFVREAQHWSNVCIASLWTNFFQAIREERSQC